MKIQAFDLATNKPLAFKKVKVQIKGQNDLISLTTDASGFLQLDDALRGKQVAVSISELPSDTFITATEGAKLKVETETPEKAK